MPWENDNALADDQANLRFLERVRESIDVVLSSSSVEDGVALGACSEMIEYARSFKHVLGSEETDAILPEGLLRRPMFVDATAQALLNEADSADGGTRG
ncbi:unnamed protein product, partial [Ectocarpus fasciculatus]